MTENPWYEAPDYLTESPHQLDVERIRTLRAERVAALDTPALAPLAEAVEMTADLRAEIQDFSSAQVVFDAPASEVHQPRLKAALDRFRPWKKGPWRLFGIDIDAEWRSDLKWSRIVPHMASLEGRTVADIGCHNGYFMFRMLAHEPRRVIGFEPNPRHAWSFRMMQAWARRPELTFERLGVEHIDAYRGYFDTIFCLGILYHHTDPVGLLRKLFAALRPGGELWIDCQGIPGTEPVALTPRGRYARARGIWFLPTRLCLEHWIARAGFRHIEHVFGEALQTHEQRSTPWANIDSLEAFLDPHDPSRTIEGYPAPWRFYVRAQRP